MSEFSELSVLELAAERAELLPEREALQMLPLLSLLNGSNTATITQTATNTNSGDTGNAFGLFGDASSGVTQTIDQSATIYQNTGVVIPG